MPTGHVVYFLLLPTAISPLVWERYFSWLLAPVLFVIIMSLLNGENEKNIPPILFSCGILTYAPVAWVGSLALVILQFMGEWEKD
jgi:hypothetical protein